jgi:hypothetical protein
MPAPGEGAHGPGGMALRLLPVVQKHGLKALTWGGQSMVVKFGRIFAPDFCTRKTFVIAPI